MSEAPKNPYEALGADGIVALVDRFYDTMDTLPEAAKIRRMHRGDLAPIRDKLATFLIGWMGGPGNYTERFGPINMPAMHAPYAIGPAERDAWLTCMHIALADAELPDAFRERIELLMSQMAQFGG